MHAKVQGLGKDFHATVRPENVIVHTPIAKADAILVLGNRMRGSALILARRAATLYREKLSNRIIVSGGVTNDEGRVEADHIRACLRAMGVPAHAITTERRSTNTKENIIFSRNIALRMRDMPRRPAVIVIGQLFASKRILMTIARQWPEAKAMIAPVCMMGLPPNRWDEHPWAMHTVRREIEKLPQYCEQGDLAHLDVGRHTRALAIYKARSSHPRPARG